MMPDCILYQLLRTLVPRLYWSITFVLQLRSDWWLMTGGQIIRHLRKIDRYQIKSAEYDCL